MMTLETGLGKEITSTDLQETIDEFEHRYSMTTARFLERFDNPLDDLDGVDDADHWHVTFALLMAVKAEENEPIPPWNGIGDDEQIEGPKGSSSFCDTPYSRIAC